MRVPMLSSCFSRWFAAAVASKVGDFLEDVIERTYQHILREGHVAIDGGASYGRHTVPMADLVGAHGRVIAFEPLPGTAEYLSRIVPRQVSVRNKAVSNFVGKADYFRVHGNEWISGLRIDHSKLDAERIMVPVTTLDKETARLRRRVRVIKLDLEGGEYHALQGARRLIERDSPFIILECGGPADRSRQEQAERYGYCSDDFFALFASHDYTLFDIFGRHFTPNLWASYDGRPWNLMAVKKDTYDEEYILGQHYTAVEMVYGNRQIASLDAGIAKLEQLYSTQQTVEQERQRAAELAQSLEQERQHMAELAQSLEQERQHTAELAQSLEQERQCTAELAQHFERERQQTAELAQHCERERQQTAEFAQACEEIRRSTSWRITSPLRWLGRQLRAKD